MMEMGYGRPYFLKAVLCPVYGAIIQKEFRQNQGPFISLINVSAAAFAQNYRCIQERR